MAPSAGADSTAGMATFASASSGRSSTLNSARWSSPATSPMRRDWYCPILLHADSGGPGGSANHHWDVMFSPTASLYTSCCKGQNTDEEEATYQKTLQSPPAARAAAAPSASCPCAHPALYRHGRCRSTSTGCTRTCENTNSSLNLEGHVSTVMQSHAQPADAERIPDKRAVGGSQVRHLHFPVLCATAAPITAVTSLNLQPVRCRDHVKTPTTSLASPEHAVRDCMRLGTH